MGLAPVGVGVGLALALLVSDPTVPHPEGRTGDVHDEPTPATRRGPQAAFVENRGQWAADVAFAWRGSSSTAWIERGRFHVRPNPRGDDRAPILSMAFEDADGASSPRGQGPLEGGVHFIRGRSRTSQAPARRFERVVQSDLYPGVDLQLRSSPEGLAYDVLLDDPADLAEVAIRCTGADRLALNANGQLVAQVGAYELRQQPPRSWQVRPDGSTIDVPSRFRLIDDARFGFEADILDPSMALVVDPGLEWSTLIGGSISDDPYGVTVGPDGSVYLCGATRSMDFPVTGGAFDPTHGGGGPFGNDVFVAKLTPDGSELVFATYLGGNANEEPVGIHVMDDGAAILAGFTGSPDFPTTPGAYDTVVDDLDGFVCKLSADGSSMIWSTVLGGTDCCESIEAMDVDALGRVVVAGCTSSLDHPTTPGAFQPTPPPGFDDNVFVSVVSSTGEDLLASTYLGGSASESVAGIGFRPGGSIVIAGRTISDDFPVTPGAWSTEPLGGGYVTHLSADLSSVLASTYFEDGSGATSMDVDTLGNVYLAGTSTGDGFTPTAGAFDETFGGVTDGWVAKYSANLSSLLYATHLGGGPGDGVSRIVVDSAGAVTVLGGTRSTDFPTTPGCAQPVKAGNFQEADTCVSRLSPDGSTLLYSTFLGGSGDEFIAPDGGAIWLGPEGEIIVGAATEGADFPTTPGAYSDQLVGTRDAFVTKLDMLPTGVAKLGPSTPGSSGPLALGVTTMPQLGSSDFAFTCTQAPPLVEEGLLIVGEVAVDGPLSVLGTDLYVTLRPPFFRVPASSDEAGYAVVSAPIPDVPALAGLQLAAQFLWPDAQGPRGWSASNAVAVTVQP